MIWVISGSRNGSRVLRQVLGAEVERLGRPEHVVCGDARGVDDQAESWFHSIGIRPQKLIANWDTYGTRAGAIRNTAMLRRAWSLGTDIRCYGFPCPLSVGTWNLLAQAYSMKLVVQYYSLRERVLIDVPSVRFCRQMQEQARERREQARSQKAGRTSRS